MDVSFYLNSVVNILGSLKPLLYASPALVGLYLIVVFNKLVLAVERVGGGNRARLYFCREVTVKDKEGNRKFLKTFGGKKFKQYDNDSLIPAKVFGLSMSLIPYRIGVNNEQLEIRVKDEEGATYFKAKPQESELLFRNERAIAHSTLDKPPTFMEKYGFMIYPVALMGMMLLGMLFTYQHILKVVGKG